MKNCLRSKKPLLRVMSTHRARQTGKKKRLLAARNPLDLCGDHAFDHSGEMRIKPVFEHRAQSCGDELLQRRRLRIGQMYRACRLFFLQGFK